MTSGTLFKCSYIFPVVFKWFTSFCICFTFLLMKVFLGCIHPFFGVFVPVIVGCVPCLIVGCVLHILHKSFSCNSLLCNAKDVALLVPYSHVGVLHLNVRISCSADEWLFSIFIDLYSIPHIPQWNPTFYFVIFSYYSLLW